MTHPTLTYEQLLDRSAKIMSSFNFKKVHEHMVEKNHRWYMGNGEMRVPEINEIEDLARSLLSKAIHSDLPVTNVGTGSLMVYKMPWGLQLVFQLEWAQ